MTGREAGIVSAIATTRRVISGRRFIISPLATDDGASGRYVIGPLTGYLKIATLGRDSLLIRSARERIPMLSRVKAFRLIGRHDIAVRRKIIR